MILSHTHAHLLMERLEPERHVILSHTHAHLFMERLEQKTCDFIAHTCSFVHGEA